MKKYLVLLIPAVLLYADVAKETYSKVNMMGGTITSEVTTKTEIRPNMKSEDMTTEAGISIMTTKMHMGDIVRLDKDLSWQLNYDKKTYTESPVSLPPNQAMTGTPTGKRDTTKQYRIVKSEFTVKKLDSTRTINGFPCTAYLATWTLVTEDTTTKKQSTSVMTLKEWTTPETDVMKQAAAQEAAFQQAYLLKLGLSTSPEESQMMGMQYLATIGMSQKDLGDKLKNNAAELAKIQGYPIVIESKWGVAGDTSKANKTEPNKEESETPTTSGGLAAALNNALARQIAPKPAENQENTMFSSYTEVKSIKVSSTPDADYEVPAGYKKAEK